MAGKDWHGSIKKLTYRISEFAEVIGWKNGD